MLELFEKQKLSRVRPPTISFRKGGFIAVNIAAMRLLGVMNGHEKKINVHLLLDREENTVVIRKMAEADANTFALRQRTQPNSGYMITALSFFNALGLNQERPKRFKAEKYAEGMICFELKCLEQVKKGERRAT